MAGRLTQASGSAFERARTLVGGDMRIATKHVILVNGPPESGKDEVGRILHETCEAHVTKFAKRLKEMTHALYGLMEGGLPRRHDYYEDCKNEPHPDFRGMSPRNAYIAVSEDYFKRYHGERIFGELLLEELVEVEAELVVISDSGFEPEAYVMLDHYGLDRVKLIRIHRPGKCFKGDSRGYIHLPGVETVDLQNDSDIPRLVGKVRDYALQMELQAEGR